MDEKKDYSFIQEKIKERPINRKKLFRRTVITALMAVLFGTVACLTFLLLEPVINKKLNPKEVTKVQFPEEERELMPQELLTEETVALKEEAHQEAVKEEAKEAAKEEVQKTLSNARPIDSISDYEGLYDEMLKVAQSAEKSMVSVIGISQREDWFAGTFENENVTTGMVVANTGAEVLVLADSNQIINAAEYRVVFSDKKMVKASLKQVDSQTGLAVYAVPLEEMNTQTLGSLSIATIGSSSYNRLVGKPVIAIGAPYGTVGSISYGMITSNESILNVTDAAYKLLMTDINAGPNSSGVIINLKGEVIGVVTQGAKSLGGSNTVSSIAISEIKPLIERLSNAEPRAYVGILGMDVTENIHAELEVPYGVYVSEVLMQSPAMHSGILNGDVITQIGETTISSYSEYRSVVMKLTPQQEVPIIVMRSDGRTYHPVELTITPDKAE